MVSTKEIPVLSKQNNNNNNDNINEINHNICNINNLKNLIVSSQKNITPRNTNQNNISDSNYKNINCSNENNNNNNSCVLNDNSNSNSNGDISWVDNVNGVPEPVSVIKIEPIIPPSVRQEIQVSMFLFIELIFIILFSLTIF